LGQPKEASRGRLKHRVRRRAFVFAAQRATLSASNKRRDAQRTMSAFGQKVAAPVRTYEEEMKFLSRNDATSWTIKPGFVPNMRVKRGVMHRRQESGSWVVF